MFSPAPSAALQPGRLLMRKCACGNHATGSECEGCRRSRVQRKPLAIGAAHGALEDEADHAAASVMGGQSAGVAGGRPVRLSRLASDAASGAGEGVPPVVHEVLRSPGQALESGTRHFMESRFGRDFSGVRVHADAHAAGSARAVGALAYTVGHDVVFGEGRYQPASHAGRTLIAHELAHVVQQQGGGLLQRAPDPAAVADFDKRLAKIKQGAVYQALDASAKKEVDEIADIARKRDNVGYYAGKLELLFATAEQPAAAQAAATSKETTDAATAEAARMGTAGAKAAQGKEETVSKSAARRWRSAQGRGATFLIDSRDPTDIAVRAKVRLSKAGQGSDADVLHVKSLEDAIEKRASTLGYTVDLTFVDKAGPDVFSVDVDTSQWTVSGNWVGSDIGLAHELHHLLGLEEDRYDYIESHADNAQMKIPDRIHWFRTELSKVIDNNALSIMNSGENLPLDDDVCMVAGNKARVDIDACAQKRSAARGAKLQPGLTKARDRAGKAATALGNAGPGGKQKEALELAQHVFGKPMGASQLSAPVQALPPQLTLNNLHLVSLLTPGCDTRPAQVSATPPRIRLCPSFLDQGEDTQAKALLGEALHANGVGDAKTDADCSKPACGDPCGGEGNAKAWTRFVECSANL
ncbi:MAG TPA: DUF4157 domain-containing protein [Albitalea sp.]|nr:DUF4157 domain-containing protein [Albitalea sp.]